MIGNIKKFIYIYFYVTVNFFANRGKVTILMYHHANDTLPLSETAVSSEKFEEQMRYLKKFCYVMRMDDLRKAYIDKKEFQRRRKPQIVITLDDGHRDNFLNAYPILKRFDLAASIFLTTGSIRKDDEMTESGQMTSPDFLGWREIAEMKIAKKDMTFYSHTENHPDLSKLDFLQQKEECQKGVETLAKNLAIEKNRAKIFAYPYGAYNGTTLNVLRELDIELAVTVNEGSNTGGENPLELKRIGCDGNDQLSDFIQKVSPSIINVLRHQLRVLARKIVTKGI